MIIFPTKVEELPKDDFFAILTLTENGVWKIEVFGSKESWQHEIISLETKPMKPLFKAIHARPAKIVWSVSVE
jgi:hypothetical protein